METEKEKSKEGRLNSSSIPLDITIEILLRLPAKSIVRFRCVSKLWSSMTNSPHFVKSFTVHSWARPCLLSVKKEKDKRVFFSFPHHHYYGHPTQKQLAVEKYETMLPKEDSCVAPTGTYFPMVCFDIRQSIHGLINFGNFESVIIWNPTLREHVTLPDPPNISKPLISVLGYDPIGDEYKVLCMSLCEDARKNGEHPQVFTMGTQESWRTIISPSPIHCTLKSWRCIKGVVYYFASDYKIIVSFNVRSEKFRVIQIPETVLFGSQIINHRGRLALYLSYAAQIGIELWVLEEEEKEWSQEGYICPFSMIDLNLRDGYLLSSGETEDGEFIYLPASLPSTSSKDVSFYAIYYDFKREVFRRVEYDGMDHSDFRFDCFPNHVESLLSLSTISSCTSPKDI